MSSTANKIQVGGDHYKSGGMQHWDWVVAIALPYLLATMTKYLTRWRKKNGMEDLEKSAHYLAKQIEELQQRRNDIFALSKKFCDDNNVGVVETEIIMDIAEFHAGDIGILLRAQTKLKAFIDFSKPLGETLGGQSVS